MPNPIEGGLPVRFYTGPEVVQGGMSFRLIDPINDEPANGDEYQHQLHADQTAVVLAVLPAGDKALVLVETADGARFEVERKFLVEA